MHIKTGILLFLIIFGTTTESATGDASDKKNKAQSEIILSDCSGLSDIWELKFFEGLETTALCEVKKIHGRNAAELSWLEGSSNFGIQPVTAVLTEGDAVYELSAEIFTERGGVAQVQVDILDSNGKCMSQEKSDEVSDDKEWKKLSISFKTPEKSTSMRLYCLNRGQGTVWYSRISLKKGDKEFTANIFPVKFTCEPADGNAIWNNGKTVFNTFIGSPCTLTFDFWGDKNKLNSPAFIIELPEEINIAECFYTHAKIENQKLTPVKEPISKNNKKYIRYSFLKPECFNMLEAKPAWCRSLSFLFNPAENINIENKNFKAYAFVRNGKEKSAEKVFYINFLPPMRKTANPKNFYGMLWCNHDLAVSDNSLFKSMLTHFEEANLIGRSINTWGRPQVHEQDTICRERGWRLFFTGNIFRISTEHNAVLYNGKKSGHICPSFILSKEGFAKQKELFKSLSADNTLKNEDIVVLDYEPWQSSEWCFCDNCRKRFGEFSGLHSPSIEDIRKKHIAKWANFRVKDSCEILRQAVQIIRENNPNQKVMDYDYPIDFSQKDFEKRFRSIPKDSRLSDEFLDGHMNSFYHYTGKSAFNLMSVNTETLHKPVFILPMISRYTDPNQKIYTSLKETLSPEQIEITILAGAASGARGLSIWPGIKIDAKYFQAIDNAMELIARFEDLYMDGERTDSSATLEGENIENLGLRIHKLKKQMLITIFNFDEKKSMEVTIKLNLPAGQYQLSNPRNETIYLSPDAKTFWTSEQLRKTGLSGLLSANKAKFIILKSLD